MGNVSVYTQLLGLVFIVLVGLVSINLYNRTHHHTAKHAVLKAIEHYHLRDGHDDMHEMRSEITTPVHYSVDNTEPPNSQATSKTGSDEVDVDSIAHQMKGRRTNTLQPTNRIKSLSKATRPPELNSDTRTTSVGTTVTTSVENNVAAGNSHQLSMPSEIHQHHVASRDTEYTLVIVLGCAPWGFDRRAALRRTWLQWALERPDVMHLFFTENITKESKRYDENDARRIQQEYEQVGDMVFQEGASGYGKENGRRELFHIQYMLDRYKFKYYLRVDDDGFLCLRQLLEDIRLFPNSILHGKYHCHDKKARMDENYLLMSRDLAAVLAEGFSTNQLPFAPKLTFALSLGNLVPMLQANNVHIFDDQTRFCWPYGKDSVKLENTPCHRAWRGKHAKRPGQFCDGFIWSHWVKRPNSFNMIYILQVNDSDTDTMRLSHKQLSGYTSPRDPHVSKLLATPVCDKHLGFNLGPNKTGVPYYINPANVVGPNWGIPGMRPLAEDSGLLEQITANVTRLFAKHRRNR